MLKKLVHIKNYAKFCNYNVSNCDWDGCFKKVNIIYAPNGSGKTSLSVLLRSIKGNNDLIFKKQTFDTSEKPSIKFILNDGKELKFNSGWNKTISEIEVFDSFYFENNLYSISIDDDPQKANIFELAIRDEIEEIKQKIIDLKTDRTLLAKKITNRKTYLKRSGGNIKTDKALFDMVDQRQKCDNEISALETNRLKKTEEQRNKYVRYINKYLALFCDEMEITEIKTSRNSQAKTQNIVYGLKINNHNITIKERNSTSLKYYLSEGDKNALALSFFLARMDMLPNLNSYIVVVDDPFTSFDTQRKLTTITQVANLSQKVGQMFLLTHDMHFAYDFNNVCHDNVLNLKIQSSNSSSALFLHDLEIEMLTGLYKDLNTLRTYLQCPKTTDSIYLREVVRCIRPSIEGVFRIKYFDRISSGQWLGDFIKMIRQSHPDSPLFRLQEHLGDIEEINNYSKIYHHSNPTYLEVGISATELKNYVKRTLKLIEIL